MEPIKTVKPKRDRRDKFQIFCMEQEFIGIEDDFDYMKINITVTNDLLQIRFDSTTKRKNPKIHALAPLSEKLPSSGR